MKEEILKFLLVYQCYVQLYIALKSRTIITLKMRLTKEERIKIVELHFRNNCSVVSLRVAASVAETPICRSTVSRLDLFLWGYLREKVYIEMPDTIHELKRKHHSGNKQHNTRDIKQSNEQHR